MPGFTEESIGTYLQIAISILIFGLGIPALIMQIIVPEELRSIVHKWRFGFNKGAYLVIIAALFSAFFVWCLDPNERNGPAIYNFYEYPRIVYFLPSLSRYQLFISQVLVTVLIFLLLLFWLLQITYRKDRVLNFLSNKCLREIRKGVLNENILADIAVIGQGTEDGSEKKMVLEKIKGISTIYINNCRYDGSNLEPIIQCIEMILTNGSEDMYDYGMKIIRSLSSELYNKRMITSTDMGALLRAFRRLGSKAIIHGFEKALLSNLSIIVLSKNESKQIFQEANRTLFELGTLALSNKRFITASAILSKHETLIMQQMPLTSENSFYYLGLIAHLLSYGGSARARAQLSLKKITFSPDIQGCLKSSVIAHRKAAAFETADRISDIMANPKNKKILGC